MTRQSTSISRIRLSLVGLMVAIGVLLPGLAAAGDLKVAKPWISLPIVDEPALVYFIVQNAGKKEHKLVGATSPLCERIEIHRAALKDGAMGVDVIDEMAVPAGGAVAFVPRGLSLAMIGAQELEEDQKVPIELEFSNGEKVAIEATALDK